jgi:hypothetical protein
LLSIVPNDGQLIILSASGCDHQDDPTDEGDDPQQTTDNIQRGNGAKHPRQDAHHTKENEGLPCVEADKALLFLQQNKDEACDPTANVAEPAVRALNPIEVLSSAQISSKKEGSYGC